MFPIGNILASRTGFSMAGMMAPMILRAALLFLFVLPAYAADEKPSGAEKAVNSVGRALEGAGKNVGRAVERTGDNIWIKKGPKKAAKKKEKAD